jgi:hypothetical protein
LGGFDGKAAGLTARRCMPERRRRREDAERFIEEVRGDEPALAKALRVEERDLEAGGLN